MKWITLLLILVANLSYGQVVSGRIVDQDSLPLPFATVYFEGLNGGCSANGDGRFSFSLNHVSLPVLDTLRASYVGYETVRTPVYLSKNKTNVIVVLSSVRNELKMFSVEGLPVMPAKKILKKALRKRKRNYLSKYSSTKGFYRELLKQGDQYVGLNEATFRLKYSGYPQGRFQNQAFNAYYDLDKLSRMRSQWSLFRHMIQFPSYLPINKDEIEPISVRCLDGLSSVGTGIQPIGGIGNLVALDKVKYAYDFFDPRRMKDYIYKLKGEEIVDGRRCYVIDFYPNPSREKVVYQPINKKMKFAVFTGRIYVEGNSFTVIEFECQLATTADFRIYEESIPKEVRIHVQYKKYEAGWMLHKVKTSQLNTWSIRKGLGAFTCEAELKLGEPVMEKRDVDDDKRMLVCKTTLINDYQFDYDKGYWDRFEKSTLYTPLSTQVVKSLEQEDKLERLFNSINLPLDSLPKPVYQGDCDTMEPQDSASLAYMEDELRYLKLGVRKFKKITNGLYWRARYLYPGDTAKTQTTRKKYSEIDGVSVRMVQDSLGEVRFFRLNQDSSETSLINVTAERAAHANFNLEDVSFNEKEHFAYLFSEEGNISYALRYQNDSGFNTLDSVYKFKWLSKDRLLYVKTSKSGRWCAIVVRNTRAHTDQVVYAEDDLRYDVDFKTSSRVDRAFIVVASLTNNEYHFLDFDGDSAKARLIHQRTPKVTAAFDIGTDGRLLGLIKEPDGTKVVGKSTNNQPWETVFEGSAILDFHDLPDYICYTTAKENRILLHQYEKKNGKHKELKFDRKYQTVELVKDAVDSNIIKVELMASDLPFLALKINLENGSRDTVYHSRINRVANQYEVETVHVETEDGVKVPMTLFKNKVKSKHIHGVLMRGYGAYGSHFYPSFSEIDMMLADDGFVIAYPHVRGSGALGIDWYESGRQLKKRNTFEDFAACGKYLKDRYNLERRQLSAYGLSAGGLIMGAMANSYPDLFGTLIFDRPFLDVLDAMMDSTKALTTMEYDEWGNPNDPKVHEYISSYSPYQNITASDLPNMFFIGGTADQQAPYDVILKSVAKYRQANQGNGIIMLNTMLGAGHRGYRSESQNFKVRINWCSFLLNNTGLRQQAGEK